MVTSTYTIEKTGSTAAKANAAYRREAASLAKKLASHGGLPDPTELVYRVLEAGRVGESEISFSDAQSSMADATGDLTFEVTAKYKLTGTQRKALTSEKPTTAGPGSNAHFGRTSLTELL